MLIDELEKELLDILQDSVISDEEKSELRAFASHLSPDKIRFMRNNAFKLAKHEMTQSPELAIRTLKWLERLMKAVDLSGEVSRIRSSAHFSPGHACRN